MSSRSSSDEKINRNFFRNIAQISRKAVALAELGKVWQPLAKSMINMQCPRC